MRDNLKKNQKRWATLLLALFFCVYYLVTPLTSSVPPEATVYANLTTTATGGALGIGGTYTITNEYSNYLLVNGNSEKKVIVKEGEEVTITVLPTELFTEGGYCKESVEAL